MTKFPRYYSDGLPLSEAEACVAVIHHLRCAAMFFEPCADEPGARLLAELNRQLLDGDKPAGKTSPQYQAALAFLNEIDRYYAALAEEYP